MVERQFVKPVSVPRSSFDFHETARLAVSVEVGVDNQHVWDVLREAAKDMKGLSAACDFVAGLILQTEDARSRMKLDRRDAAYRAALAEFVGSAAERSRAVCAEVHRYADCQWLNRDKYLSVMPSEYATDRKRFYFDILSSGGREKILGERSIRRLLQTGATRGFLPGQTVDHDLANGSLYSWAIEIEEGHKMSTAVTNSDFINGLRSSSEGKKIEREVQERRIAERQKLVDAIAELDAKSEENYLKGEKLVEYAIVEEKKAFRAWQSAKDKITQAVNAKSAASLNYTMARSRLVGELSDSACKVEIDQFIDSLIDEMGLTRKKHVGGWTTVTNKITGRREERGYSNAASLNARLSAIKEAMEEAERLRLVADQSDVAGRLAALRSALPEVSAPNIPDA